VEVLASHVDQPASHVEVLASHVDQPASHVEVLASHVDQPASKVQVLASPVDGLASEENGASSSEDNSGSSEDDTTSTAGTADPNVNISSALEHPADLRDSTVPHQSSSSNDTSDEDDFVLINPNTKDMDVDESKSDASSNIEVIVDTHEKERDSSQGGTQTDIECLNDHTELTDGATNYIDEGLIRDVNETQNKYSSETNEEIDSAPSSFDKDCILVKTNSNGDEVTLNEVTSEEIISSNGLASQCEALLEHSEVEGIVNASQVDTNVKLITIDVNKDQKPEEAASTTEKPQSFSASPSTELAETATSSGQLGCELDIVNNSDTTCTQEVIIPASKSDPENDLSIESQ